MEDVEKLKIKIKELEKKVKISRQSLEQYALIKKKYAEALDFLNRQKKFIVSVIESNQNAIIAINRYKKVVIFNSSAENMFGFSKKEMLNKDSLHKIIPEHLLQMHDQAANNFLKTGNSIGIINNKVEMEGKRKDGTIFPVRMSFGVDFKNEDMIVVANIDDMSIEKKHLQLLEHQSKMAAMGEMIGAIAHQWRQPLSVISTSIQNLQYDYLDGNLKDEKFVEEYIEKNKKIIMFMSKTIDDFRSFFRVDKEKIDFKVKETTMGVVNMLSAQLKHNNITLNLKGEEFIFHGFQSEYQQVILNIINNSKDASIDRKIENPIIDIVIEKNRITIKDNAGGIEENIIDRIFEPYFTTKEEGKGTGMGLYISKMIIENNMEGSLRVKNENKGAVFTMILKRPFKIPCQVTFSSTF